MKNKQSVLKSIQDGEERMLFAHVLDAAEFAQRRRQMQFTDFFDEAKCGRFLARMESMYELQMEAFGGVLEGCERKLIGFCAPYESLTEEVFPIVVLEIRVKHKKFAQSDLSHRDYLGSIMGLGIERGKIGDILLTEDGALCFVKEELADYIVTQLEQVSRTAVSVAVVAPTAVVLPKRTELRRLTVASMRLDAVLGEALSLSRGKAQALISAEKVQVNWAVAQGSAQGLSSGDMVSARGFGRFRVGEAGNLTKKGRLVLEIEQYI